MSESNTAVAVMKSLSDALGMAPLVIDAATEQQQDDQLPVVYEEIELSKEDKEAEEDFYITRENTKLLLEKGQEALDGILRIASASEHPRAFEVAANLLKTVQEMNNGLLKLHESRRQLVPVPEPEKKAADESKQITNNNVFIGSTQEFLDMLEAREQDKFIEHEP